MGEINADLVIGAWPQKREAAVAEVTNFSEGDARAAVISPPSKKGHVHATQEE